MGKKIGARWLCAAALAVAASMSGSAVSAADTPEGKELVILGDSFSSNAWILESDTLKCWHGETSWPTQLSALMGVAGTSDYLDMSCPGASLDTPPSYTAVWETKQADKEGAFGPRTELVTLQFGLNDRWGAHETTMWFALQQCVLNLIEGCGTEAADQGRIPDFREVTGTAYAARIRSVVEYVKYYAPNARIVMVGYPELFPAGQDTVCFNAFGVVRFVQPRGRAAIEFVDRLDRAQREAARLLDIDFFDARRATAGHGLCTEDSWINDFQDPRDPNAIPFHPSVRGDAEMASGIHELARR
ncbi:SGNH/GDSL hydrolase family protein [Nocardia uniformis]|uniref:SGNH/GDSL hydrolase family protein n=1 Tax=Nocardia uniformis TaxID=53432 RepID=A0A849CG60_9NOCA|nr:SGNH/GDSL hydrolase family protein [Nocardia uniformis]NNH72431.1 SGNH/GDSL hydrolase family protein [Nocardia uniformis]